MLTPYIDLEPSRRGLLGRVGYPLPDLAAFKERRSGSNRIFVEAGEPKIEITGENNIVIIGAAQTGIVYAAVRGHGNAVVISGGIRTQISVRILGHEKLAYVGPRAKLNSGAILLTDNSRPTSVIIGADCLFSHEVSIRASDSHGIVDCATGQIISQPASILVEPFVWLGQSAKLLKGANVGMGSIVGAGALVTGICPRRSIMGGVPARVLRSDATWTHECEPTPKAIEERLAAVAALTLALPPQA